MRDAPLLQHPGDRDGRVVVDAEAAGTLGHRVVQPARRIERVLRAAAEHGLGGDDRGAGHARGRLVHVGEDRIVAGTEAEPPPRPWLARARRHAPRRDSGPCVPAATRRRWRSARPWSRTGRHRGMPYSWISRCVRMTRAGRSGMLGSVVVPGRIVPVPDQLDPFAHGPIIGHACWTRPPSAVGRRGRPAASGREAASTTTAYRNAGAAAAMPVSFTKKATPAETIRTIRTSRQRPGGCQRPRERPVPHAGPEDDRQPDQGNQRGGRVRNLPEPRGEPLPDDVDAPTSGSSRSSPTNRVTCVGEGASRRLATRTTARPATTTAAVTPSSLIPSRPRVAKLPPEACRGEQRDRSTDVRAERRGIRPGGRSAKSRAAPRAGSNRAATNRPLASNGDSNAFGRP